MSYFLLIGCFPLLLCQALQFDTDLTDGHFLPLKSKAKPKLTTTTAHQPLTSNPFDNQLLQHDNICFPSRLTGPVVLCPEQSVFDGSNFTLHFLNFDKLIYGTIHQTSINSRKWIPLEPQQWNQLPTIGDQFVLHSVEIHYGSSPCEGSFHALDLELSPVELHLSFFNVKHQSQDRARAYRNGIVNIVALYDFADEFADSTSTSQAQSADWENLTLWPLVGELPVPISLKQLFPVTSQNFQYFRYEGSSIQAPCFEGSVVWVVARQRFPFSRKFYASLTKQRSVPEMQREVDEIRQLRRRLKHRPTIFRNWK